ncbi:hypothetical protein ACIO6U_12785 [Streptomyces sp. NPDC087422]|uniref:hypothetical protein n=1 Tax=Streptomyces sp. NPDC087422 TaxID=3365786 RepID=UPI0038150C66
MDRDADRTDRTPDRATDGAPADAADRSADRSADRTADRSADRTADRSPGRSPARDTDIERRRKRALFLRELNEAKELRERVQPRRARVARLRQQMRMRTFRW